MTDKEEGPGGIESSQFDFDAWTTDNGRGYSRENIYGKAGDEHGHSVVKSIRVQPRVAAIIKSLIDNKRLPFKTLDEFHRDAIYHNAEYWQRKILDGELDSVLNVAMRQARVANVMDEIGEAEALVSTHTLNLERAFQVGNWMRLTVLIGFCQEDSTDIIAPFGEQLAELADKYRKKMKDKV